MDRTEANTTRPPANGQRRTRRTPRPVTAERLRRAALHHLARFATTEARLRQALERKVARSARLHGTDPAEARGWIDDILAMLRRQGLLDDPAWAARRARALHDRGIARGRIEDRLRAAGIDAATAAAATGSGPAAEGDAEAAWTFARRRRLGPFRPAGERAGHRLRDLGRMARGGFSYDTARAVIDADEAPE